VLDLPWWVADRDLAAGETVRIGRTVVEGTTPPVTADVAYEVADPVPAGTILGVGSDHRLHRLTADPPTRRTHRGNRPA
jgi:hypothetical protein